MCNRHAIDGITHPMCKKKYTLDGAISSIVYSTLVKKLLYNFKYPPYISDLKKILLPIFYEGVIQKEIFHSIVKQHPLVVPIPLTKEKEAKRGDNQAQILAEGMGKLIGLEVTSLLIRVKATKSQFMLDKKDREINLSNAFQVNKRLESRIKGEVIILIDDLLTSGSTMKEAARMLKKAGAKEVWGVTLAHGS